MPPCADMTSNYYFVKNESLTIIRLECVGVKIVTIANKYVVYDNEQDRKCTYKSNTEARSCNHCRSGNAVNITYCECVCVAFVIQHAMRMRRIVIRGLPRSTVFFRLSHKRHDFRKIKKLLNVKYLF